jgi:hypothetical protein
MTFGSFTPRELDRNRRQPVSKATGPVARRFLALVALGALTLLSPVSLRGYLYVDGALLPGNVDASARPTSPPAQIDLDEDGEPEILDLASGVVTIRSNATARWRSPSSWSVRQASFTDLNRDGKPEVSLLVWREFRPWPTDRLLPHGGRIDAFHDAQGWSCHLILIGPDGAGGFRELWAGSALADPIAVFEAVDLDRDDRQELLTLEYRYTDGTEGSSGRSLKIWVWDGFGFTAMDSVDRSIARFVVTRSAAASQIIAQVGR